MKRYIKFATVPISDEPKEVRAEVARSSTDEDILVELSEDPDTNVRWWVATNSATPLSALIKLLSDSYIPITAIALNNICNNAKAPLSIMNDLPIERVYEVALAAPALPRVKEYAVNLVKKYGTPDMLTLLKKYGAI